MHGQLGLQLTARRGWAWLVARGLGAVALLASGAVHLQQYLGPYAAIPTIGTLFLLDAAGAAVIGALLLAPVERLAGRWAGAVVAVVTAGGIALAATSYVMLLISERRPLLGFQEPGYDTTAIVAAQVSELAALALLGASLLLRFATTGPRRRW